MANWSAELGLSFCLERISLNDDKRPASVAARTLTALTPKRQRVKQVGQRTGKSVGHVGGDQRQRHQISQRSNRNGHAQCPDTMLDLVGTKHEDETVARPGMHLKPAQPLRSGLR